MYFHLRLSSLQELARVKVITILWTSKKQVRTMIKGVWVPNARFNNYSIFNGQSIPDLWPTYQRLVLEAVDKLWLIVPLPTELREDSRATVIHVGNEFFKWIQFHLNRETIKPFMNIYLKILASYFSKLRWTGVGQVDKREMVKMFVKDARIEKEQRFHLACHFNLQENIVEMWKTIRPINLDTRHLEIFQKFYPSVSNYWVHCLEGELELNLMAVWKRNPCTHMHIELFLEAARNCCKDTVSYFYEKLNSSDKRICFAQLTRTQHLKINDDLLHFVFTNGLDEGEKFTFFETQHQSLLELVVHFPYTYIFEYTTLIAFPVMGREYFHLLASLIITNAKNNRYNHCYQDMFYLLWTKAPYSLKVFIFLCKKRLTTLLESFLVLNRPSFVRIVLYDFINWGEVAWGTFDIRSRWVMSEIVNYKQWDLFSEYISVFHPRLETAIRAYVKFERYLIECGDKILRNNWNYGGRSSFKKYLKIGFPLGVIKCP